MIRKKNKLVYGVGINDASYATQKFETLGYIGGKPINKLVWRCPFYTKWRDMLARCYSEKRQIHHPTYIGCFVIGGWLTFSNFKAWMEKQDWEGKELDKDLLLRGNKMYSPDTCVFLDSKVNLFMTENTATRGKYPIGVTFDKNAGKFKAQCASVATGKRKHLGLFKTAEEAYQAWFAYKLEQAYILASEQVNERIADAIINKYKNYRD